MEDVAELFEGDQVVAVQVGLQHHSLNDRVKLIWEKGRIKPGWIKFRQILSGIIKTGRITTGRINTSRIKTGRIKTGRITNGRIKTDPKEKIWWLHQNVQD